MSDEHKICAHITLLQDLDIHRPSLQFGKKGSIDLAPARPSRSIIIMVCINLRFPSQKLPKS